MPSPFFALWFAIEFSTTELSRKILDGPLL